MSFLIDTDVCSAHLKTNALTHRFLQYLGRLHISSVTLAELYTWALGTGASPKRLQSLNDLIWWATNARAPKMSVSQRSLAPGHSSAEGF
jgi:predicted nucleic acid-binding protein